MLTAGNHSVLQQRGELQIFPSTFHAPTATASPLGQEMPPSCWGTGTRLPCFGTSFWSAEPCREPAVCHPLKGECCHPLIRTKIPTGWSGLQRGAGRRFADSWSSILCGARGCRAVHGDAVTSVSSSDPAPCHILQHIPWRCEGRHRDSTTLSPTMPSEAPSSPLPFCPVRMSMGIGRDWQI